MKDSDWNDFIANMERFDRACAWASPAVRELGRRYRVLAEKFCEIAIQRADLEVARGTDWKRIAEGHARQLTEGAAERGRLDKEIKRLRSALDESERVAESLLKRIEEMERRHGRADDQS